MCSFVSYTTRFSTGEPLVSKFVMGEPLVSKDRLGEMQTHMRSLHDWYMCASRNERIMIVLQVPKDYYFRPDEIHVEFSELFQMYNFEALD